MGIFARAVDYFQRGGICMWPLLLCSFAVVIIGVERFLYYRQALSKTEFVLEFCRLMNDFNLVGARELAARNKGEAAKLAVEVLDIEEDLGSRLEGVVYAKLDRSLDSLEKNLDYLSVVIGLSPMLGLLGTVTGMMGAFTSLNDKLINPLGVTAGLAEALITTVFGLSIAIPGMLIYAYLASRLKTATLNLNDVATVLNDIIAAKNNDEPHA